MVVDLVVGFTVTAGRVLVLFVVVIAAGARVVVMRTAVVVLAAVGDCVLAAVLVSRTVVTDLWRGKPGRCLAWNLDV